MGDTEDSGGGLDGGGAGGGGAGVSIRATTDLDVFGEKVINDGLLCSILHAMSGAPNADELASRIERDCTDVTEILLARKKLFTYYNGVICSERNKLVLDIDRLTTKGYIKDIVDQLVKVDKVTEVKMFCMPFDYELKKFETENARLTNVIEKEMSNEFEMKIEALEHRMNEKNRALHDFILESVNRALKQSPSYAGVALGARPKEVLLPGHGQGQGNAGSFGGQLGAMGPPLQPGAGDGVGRHNQQLGVGGNNRIRGRSPGVKRLRSSDGSSVAVQDEVQERSGSRPPQKKCVVGTSNNSVLPSRKMRSPPADIFVWGIHPDTTIPDIVADLAESAIIVQEKDVQKKSKPEANLVSYKISVKAEDLQRALDPAVWPLRVKVREFIYYARKNPRQQRGQQGQHTQQAGEGHQVRLDHGQGREGQHGGGYRQQGELSVATNRFALPGEGVPGGPGPMV